MAHIAKQELENKAFIKYLSWFDDSCEDYYILRNIQNSEEGEIEKQ